MRKSTIEWPDIGHFISPLDSFMVREHLPSLWQCTHRDYNVQQSYYYYGEPPVCGLPRLLLPPVDTKCHILFASVEPRGHIVIFASNLVLCLLLNHWYCILGHGDGLLALGNNGLYS